MSEAIGSSLKSAVKGTGLVFMGTVGGILLWFATKILIIRATTKEELGIYSLAVAVVSVFATISSAGLQDGTTRFISMYLGEGRKEDADGISRSAIHIGGALGLASSALLFAFAGPISEMAFYMPELTAPLRAISAFSFFYVISNILVGIIRGYGNIRPRVYFINIGQPLFFLILLTFCFALKLPFIGILYAFVLALMLTTVCAAVYGRKLIGLDVLALGRGSHGRELIMFSLPLLATTVMGMVFNWTDTLMLGRYASAADVGVYNVSISLARLMTFVISAAAFAHMPIAADLYSRKQHDEFKRSYQVLTKWVFSATLPIFFILFFFPAMAIQFLFGGGFEDAALPLSILAAGYMAYVLAGNNSVLLIVLGRARQLMYISLIGGLLNIALNYILIKRLAMGLVGAAVATSVSFVIISLMAAILLYRLSGVHPLTGKYLRPIASSGAIGLLIYGITKSLSFSFGMAPLYLILFIVGYGASILLTHSIDEEDIGLLEAILRRTGIEIVWLRNFINKFKHS